MAERPRLAIYWAASCGGCEIAFLEIQEHLLEIADLVDLVFCPCLVDTKVADVEAMADASIDVCLWNGALRTEENLRMARLLREKSQVLVAFGACAHLGGIPGLANAYPLSDLLERVYVGTESTVNPERVVPSSDALFPNGEPAELPGLLPAVGPLHHAVQVDYVIPGCPPEAHQVWAALQAILAGALPAPGQVVGAGDATVCEECPLEKRDTAITGFQRIAHGIPEPGWCLLEQGFFCAGVATRSGCGARCPSVGVGCRGCYGPSGAASDPGLELVGGLGGLVAPAPGEGTPLVTDGLLDPLGTLFRFSLPSSPLHRWRADGLGAGETEGSGFGVGETDRVELNRGESDRGDS